MFCLVFLTIPHAAASKVYHLCCSFSRLARERGFFFFYRYWSSFPDLCMIARTVTAIKSIMDDTTAKTMAPPDSNPYSEEKNGCLRPAEVEQRICSSGVITSEADMRGEIVQRQLTEVMFFWLLLLPLF